MMENKLQSTGREIKQVTKLALIVNFLLFAVKLGVGFLAGSKALITDGIHSLSDMVTDLTVLFGIRISLKEPDAEHQYGHGRAETLTTFLIGLVLLFSSWTMIYYSAVDITMSKTTDFSIWVVIAAVVSILVKEGLCRLTKKIAIKTHSSALYANAWHQRSDALSSIAVVVGHISLHVGFKYGDQIAAIAVGMMITLVAFRLLGECLRELTERAADTDTIEHIKKIIDADPSIHQWHKLRTRTVGREVFLDLHILVNPDLKITTAHQIAENLERALHEQIVRPVNITVHIEPDIPELRK